ncbi:hypothetical protein TCAL_11589 [Tigriopus californicus]|uniref:lysozyme n=1 Tax=Tigriopus californicus TaxID=6832 RepID=A0A553NEJ4_TIGCA|nr:lysozyme c-1-like [Tigriopus californicus]TRY63866.1 hypothetical protein TCAL_11589 [Tigriopus californicus]|eukprot:TCALIF_11589-PA protein Name:"Similar to AGAP007347 Lysozyme c-1 (Anopheles gambiae)" AED:0.08 eAED:0.08 QI:10/1/1/1/1/1/3/74/152
MQQDPQQNSVTMKFLISLAVLAIVGCAQAKVYSKCELATEMVNKHGFSRSSIGDWVCLVNYESSFNTRATNDNTNGSRDYGIFEINDNYWCDSNVGAGNDCNAVCSNFIDDNIADDCACAKKIYARHGFEAWYGWKNHCKGHDNEEWVAGCF